MKKSLIKRTLMKRTLTWLGIMAITITSTIPIHCEVGNELENNEYAIEKTEDEKSEEIIEDIMVKDSENITTESVEKEIIGEDLTNEVTEEDSEEITPTEEAVITEEVTAEALVDAEEVTTKESIITKEIDTTEETLDYVEEEIELLAIAEDTIYEINSQEDWDNLIHGITDSTNWQDGVYVGVDDVSITLNCNIISDIEIIKFTNDVTWNINLNNNTFSSIPNTFGVKFINDSGNYYTSGSVNVYNGIISETGLDFSKGISNVTISGVQFTNCTTTAINVGYCGGKVDVSDCTILHAEEDNTDIGINSSYLYGNSSNVSISNVSISGFYNGIMGGYSSCPKLLKSIIISDAHVGIDLLYGSSGKTVISDCEIIGNGESDSVGIKAGFSDGSTSSRWFLENERSNSYIEDCHISGFEIGIKCEASYYISVYNSTISNVINGIVSSPVFIFVKDSTITASESVNTYGGNSYGVANTSGSGYLVLSSEISGFKIGSYNSGGSGHIIGCTYDNLDINADVYQSIIYGSSLKNARIGVRLYSATVTVINSEVIGKGEDGSIGIEGSNGSVFSIIGTDKGVTIPYSDSDGVINYVNTNMPDCYYKMVIKNYDIGAKDPGSQFYPIGLEIKDCSTGIDMSRSQLHTGLNGYQSSINNPVEIHDCVSGITTSAGCYLNGSDIIIHDCSETGFKSTNYVSGVGTTDDCYKYEVYNCRNGFDVSNGNIVNTILKSYDNKEKGIKISGNSNVYVPLQSYNNGDYNLYVEGNVSMTIQPGVATKTIESPTGNVYLDVNSSEQAIRFTGEVWESDNNEIYLTNGRKLYLSPASGTTDWLKGTMLFDVPDYNDGLPVACVPINNVNSEGNDPSLWTYKWVRTHMFAEKEGWIIKWVPHDLSVSALGELVLHEGCEVTYDYATNGGTELKTDYPMNDMNKIAYEDGSEVDLSLKGAKDNYEFVGWNTDKDAHEGLESLTAGTTDITLYAIYKTTKTVTYHTFDDNYDFTESVEFFNNEDKISHKLAEYNASPSDRYVFAGYVFDANEKDFKNNMKNKGADFEVSDSCLDVYCVYDTTGTLTYKDASGNQIGTTDAIVRDVAKNIMNVLFSYVMENKIPAIGYTFDGWTDKDGVLHEAGSTYVVADYEAVVTASESEIFVDSIVVSPKNSSIYVGDTVQLSAVVTPTTALDKTITWSVDNNGIATVNEDGLVTGITTGTITVTATNVKSGKFDTATVTVKEARTNVPNITVSNDYKVTIIAGEVADDEVDKIYYRINEGEWKEYREPFPVYKKFKVEAYQVTKIRKVVSDIVEKEGTEYADGITAEYIGEDKLIGTDVTKPEVIVTVHYPNSPDEVTTNFELTDYTIKVEGPNDVHVEYNEYPNDENSPTFTSNVVVTGILIHIEEPEARIVTIKGILKYADGTPIANKTIELSHMGNIVVQKDEANDEVYAVGGANLYKTTTDTHGNYEFKDIYVGEYELNIYDNNTVIASCKITVSAPEKHNVSIDVDDTREDVSVDYSISGNIIEIDVTITPPKAMVEPPATGETPKTGDSAPIAVMGILMAVSAGFVFLLAYGKNCKSKGKKQ